MTFDSVENLLTYTNIVAAYAIDTNGQWQSSDRAGFLHVLGQQDSPSTHQAKTSLSCLLSKRNYSFEILFNATGAVAQVGRIE
jgi:hypothetical protein